LASRELGAQRRMTSAYNLGNVGLVSKILRILELMDCSGVRRRAAGVTTAFGASEICLGCGLGEVAPPACCARPGLEAGGLPENGSVRDDGGFGAAGSGGRCGIVPLLRRQISQ
jgi:hypothetical protein